MFTSTEAEARIDADLEQAHRSRRQAEETYREIERALKGRA